MTSAIWDRSNIAAFLEAVGGLVGVPCEVGQAEDNRLTQPERIDWVPVPNSGRRRPCTVQYLDGTVFVERSFEYVVHIRAIDVAQAQHLEGKLFNALVDLNATEPSVEFGEGDIQPGSTAAEQGALITWRARVWEPIYYERWGKGHITTATTSVAVINGGTI